MVERFNEGSTGKFTLEIELGNEAMTNSMQLVEALRKVCNRISLAGYRFHEPITRGVMDTNGNTIGLWKIELDGK